MLADAAARAGAATALVFGAERLTYAQYLRCVAGFAHELQELGARGSRVALICGNSLDTPVATRAVPSPSALRNRHVATRSACSLRPWPLQRRNRRCSMPIWSSALPML